MDYLKSIFTKKQIVWLSISGGILLLFFIIAGIGVKMSESQPSQMLAQRWSKNKDYAQVSVFYSEMAGASEDSVRELNFKIDSKLDEDSLVAGSANARRRVTGYSALGSLEVKSEKNSMQVKAIGVGGDFFLFHPVKLLSGGYFDGEDVMQDHILLDNETAWQLFGSTDIVGQSVMISDRIHIISGVYERERGRLNDLAGNGEATIFVSYESLENYGELISFNCVEVLMPNPVTHYAVNTLEEMNSLDKNRTEIVENTGRFKWTKLLKYIVSFGSRSMNGKAILYPYWENAARGMEDLLTPLCAIDLLLFTFVAVNIIVVVARMWKYRTIHFSDIKNYVGKLIEESREKRRDNKKIDGGEYL